MGSDLTKGWLAMHDFHMHTNFSIDSKATMEEMVQSGVKKGLEGLCFTDHIEFDSPLVGDELYDPVEYAAEIARLKAIYGEQIDIKMGTELGWQPHVVDKMNAYVAKGDFDFVLCSLHTVDFKDLHTNEFSKGKTSAQAYARYFEAYYECVNDRFEFDVLSHYDLLKRHASFDTDQVFKDNYEIAKATFKRLIEDGRGIEINTSGFRYNINSGLPSADFLKLYKELGGEIITTGSDAHTPKDVASHFEYAYDLLRSIGFKYVTHFENRSPKFIKI